MRNPRTVFIVGAGASKEAGLPVGKELIDIIAERLNYHVRNGTLNPELGDPDILDVLQQHAHTPPEMGAHIAAAMRIRDGIIYSNSIDSFIDIHREDAKIQMCGKLAIVKSILKAEAESKLFINVVTNNFSNVQDLKPTWFFTFLKNLNDGVRKEEINRIFERVAFIVFNYDRCVEHFLFHALQAHYGIDEAKSASVMETLKIIHPYGTIGDLPWQRSNGIQFGSTATRFNLEEMMSRIKTYTEQVEEGTQLNAIRNEVKHADTLVFLGFSYHPQNMKLLKPEGPCDTEKVFGTAWGISGHDIGIIGDEIKQIVGKSLMQFKSNSSGITTREEMYIRNDLRCGELLEQYSRSLFQPGSLLTSQRD